jgi:carboxymethylenebutenolidase
MRITVPDGSFEAFVARPDAAASPAVLVIQEIFGVNDDIRSTCRELAAAGFLAVAPELFWRDAPGLDLDSRREADWQRGLELYRSYDLGRGVHDIAATVEAARAVSGSNGKAGVMGFCLGGLMAYLAAVRTDIDAVVAYYGGNIDQHLDEAGSLRTPLMLHLGDQDEFIPRKAQARILATLGENSTAAVHIYAGQSHAFARHSGAHYDAEAASLANQRTYAFFETHLRAGRAAGVEPRQLVGGNA